MMSLALPPDPFTRMQLTAWSCCQSVRAPESSLTCKHEPCQLPASPAPRGGPLNQCHTRAEAVSTMLVLSEFKAVGLHVTKMVGEGT